MSQTSQKDFFLSNTCTSDRYAFLVRHMKHKNSFSYHYTSENDIITVSFRLSFKILES